MALKIDAQREVDGVTILDLNGRITLGEGSVTIKDKVEELLAKGKKNIILNMNEVNYIDSSGIGTLVKDLFPAARNQGGEIKITHLTNKVHDLLQITKLYTVFDIKDEERAAIKAFEPKTIRLETRNADDVTIVDLKGVINGRDDGDNLKAKLSGLIRDNKNNKLVVDMKDVEYIDTFGIEALVKAREVAKEAHGDLKIVHMPMIFRIVGRAKAFDAYEHEHSAIEAFRAQQQSSGHITRIQERAEIGSNTRGQS